MALLQAQPDIAFDAQEVDEALHGERPFTGRTFAAYVIAVFVYTSLLAGPAA